MFSKKNFISLLLAAVTLLSAISLLFVSCDSTGNGTTTDNDSSGESTSTSQPTTPPEDEIALIIDSVSQVKVVRHYNLDTADPAVRAAANIRQELSRDTGADITIGDDWIKKDATYPSDTLEILVGLTDYPETATAAADLKYGDYLLTVVGNKIIVLGYTSTAINSAANTLIRLAKNSKVTDEATGKSSIVLKKSDVHATGTKNKVISAMPLMENASFSSWYESGNDSDELIFDKTTLEAYNAYLKKLEADGYKLHTTNTITKNTFATYYNSKYIINIGYYDYEKSIRMIIEPFAEHNLVPLEADNKYEVVTTSQITMIGLEYVKNESPKEYASNGLSILIRLTDGRFIVVDGGFNRQADADMLVEQMKAQSADYVSKTGGIKVAAWIITHPHGDHTGMIGNKYTTFSKNKIVVERFLVNFMADSEREKAISTYTSQGKDNWSANEGNGWAAVVSAASALNADLCTAHVGHVYYFANAKLEVLYTLESYAPALTNAFNTTCVIIKMTFKDEKTGAETVYMHTGDATGPAFSICTKMYGQYLKSDIVQVAHHGYSTWGAESGTINAYILMSPSTLLWPQGLKAYPNYRDKSYNKVLWNDKNPNYKETFVAGWEGTITVLPLPYTVGSGKVVTKTNPS